MTIMTLSMIWLGVYTLENVIRMGYSDLILDTIFRKDVESITMYIEPAIIICLTWLLDNNLLFSIFSGFLLGPVFCWFSGLFSFGVSEVLKTAGVTFDVSCPRDNKLSTFRIVLLVLNIISFLTYISFLGMRVL